MIVKIDGEDDKMTAYEYIIRLDEVCKMGRVYSDLPFEEIINGIQLANPGWKIESVHKLTCEGCILGLLSQDDHQGYGGCLEDF